MPRMPSRRPHGPRLESAFLTPRDISDQLQVPIARVYELLRTGEIPAIRIGYRGQWRIRRDDVEAYVAGHEQASEAAGSDSPPEEDRDAGAGPAAQDDQSIEPTEATESRPDIPTE